MDADSGMGLTVDVAHRFHLLFLFSFYVTAFNFVSMLVMVLLTPSISIIAMLVKLMQLAGFALTVLWIFGFIWRFSPSGRSASGDYYSKALSI